MSSEPAPAVVGVVLNWNNYEDTVETVETLRTLDYDRFKILLVDNGSTDGSADRLAERFPDLDLVRTGENLGFGPGMNVGVEAALDRGADYVWALNNDVVVEDTDLLARLVDVAERRPDIGVLTPTVMGYPETDEVWFRRGYLNWTTGSAGHRGHRNWYVDGPRTELFPDRDGLVDDDYIPFCAALVRRDVFESVGLYPESYFLYYGDVAYGTRIRDAGYRLATDTRSRIYHKESASSGGPAGPTTSYYFARNRWQFAHAFDDRVSPLFPLLFCWWLAVELGYRAIHRDWPSAWALLEGAVAGVRGETGEGRYP